MDAIKSVFRRAFRDRAPAIAEVEASEAVHAAAVEAVRANAAALATKPMKTWLTDGEPCKAICIPNSLAGPVALGEPFPSGDKWPPAHPNCRCSISIEDVPVSPATAR